MAKRYSIAKPSTGAGTANVIFAGGRGPTAKRPKAAPEASFSLDLNLEDMARKRTARAQIEALTRAGYDPAILANMGQEGIAALHGKLADDPIVAAEEAEKAKALAEEADVLKAFESIQQREVVDPEMEPFTFRGGADVEEDPMDFNLEDMVIPPSVRTEGVSPSDGLEEDFYGADEGGGIKERTNWKGGLRHGDNIEYFADGTTKKIVKYEGGKEISKETFEKPDYSKMKPQEELLARFMQTSPGVTQKVMDDYTRNLERLTPKEVDPWTHSASMQVEGKDGKNYHMTYDKDGKELRKIKLPEGDIEWVDMPVWKGDQQGSFLRDKDDPQNYIKDKDGNPKFFPLPKGFSRVRPRAEKSLSMKFNAFLAVNDNYKGLIPDSKVLLDPVDLYQNSPKGSLQEKAAIEFFQTKDATIALLEALTELQKARNKGDSKRNKKIQKLIDAQEGKK